MGHGPLPEGDWWRCDQPERRADRACVANVTECRGCLIGLCADGGSADGGVYVEGTTARRLAVEPGEWMWSDLLPFLAEYHGLPLRMLVPA